MVGPLTQTSEMSVIAFLGLAGTAGAAYTGTMHSLVNAPVLALDLVRHPSGARVCDVLDRVLVLDAHDQAALAVAGAAGPVRTPARRRLLDVAARAPRMADVLAEAARTFVDGLAGGPAEKASTELSGALVGRLPDVHAMLLGDGPLAGSDVLVEAVGAALDAVTAAWTALDPAALPADVDLLTAPWLDALPVFPTRTPLAVPDGATGSLLDLLDALARATPAQWTALDVAHDVLFDGLDWSTAMHQGCRAAAESGRTRDVARWHLAAARTAHGTGLTMAVGAPGAMMSVVAAVQATCVGDLLESATLDVLTGPCRAMLGWQR